MHNKIDVAQEPPLAKQVDGAMHVYLSAKTGSGMDLLKRHLLALAGYQNNSEGIFMARARHLDALLKVKSHLHVASAQLAAAELLAEELSLAQHALASITGEFTAVDKIFLLLFC